MIKKFNLFQEVEIVPSKNKEHKDLIGKKGVILKMVEEEGMLNGYEIKIHELMSSLFFAPDEVKATGKQFNITKKLNFFEEVEIVASENEENKHLIGKKGVILGMSEDEDYGIFYGYLIKINGEEWSLRFKPEEVKPTGKQFKYEDFYDGTCISVSLDGELLD